MYPQSRINKGFVADIIQPQNGRILRKYSRNEGSVTKIGLKTLLAYIEKPAFSGRLFFIKIQGYTFCCKGVSLLERLFYFSEKG